MLVINNYRLILLMGILVTMSAHLSGQNVLYTETFGGCELPEGWVTAVDYGGADWRVEDNIRVDPDYGDNCFLYFEYMPKDLHFYINENDPL